MIEKIIFDYLNGVDGAPPALMEIPAERQAPPFFVIQKTAGGEIEGVVGEATLAIQSRRMSCSKRSWPARRS